MDGSTGQTVSELLMMVFLFSSLLQPGMTSIQVVATSNHQVALKIHSLLWPADRWCARGESTRVWMKQLPQCVVQLLYYI